MLDDDVHPDVADALRVLNQSFAKCSLPVPEADNRDYGAAIATYGSGVIRLRVGKLTPTKVGLFVAVWRRAIDGSTEPFPVEENIGMLVVTAREGNNAGQFAFPKSALVKHGIVSVGGVGGKRGFRVYPPWSAVSNRQAKQTQQWQGAYFSSTATAN
ncbi:MepB family protein [Arthrobacter sp. EpRS71]|uniref:MepB family protein n=1 Tax=Arthrobacter sp. EpRS71 TaxID=1743141 RepID=UPI00074A5D77|nr:MepB family protein [Arthrobacter sp. EpRS71]KUM34875.1 hypothetical protein AR689_12310 [Arthrobacter sp. EpRS71]